MTDDPFHHLDAALHAELLAERFGPKPSRPADTTYARQRRADLSRDLTAPAPQRPTGTGWPQETR